MKTFYAQVDLVNGLRFNDAKTIALAKIREQNPGRWPRMENARFAYKTDGDIEFLFCKYDYDPEDS